MPVIVPAELAGPLLPFLVRALAREVRENGALVPEGMLAFLRELRDAEGPVADDGQTDDVPETIESAGMVTVAQLAEQSGFPSRSLRRWAASGRVRAVRVGRQWLLDPDSLRHLRPEDR